MPLCRINDTMLYFAHVPKTGGSSIESYMEAKGALALRHNRNMEWSATTPQHMPRRVFEKYVPTEFYDLGFAVLRDPKAKMISTYKMRISETHTWINPINWLTYAWGRLKGRKVYAIRVWKLRLSLDFDTWFWLVSKIVARRPYFYDGHFLPQSDYVAEGHKLFLFENGIDPVFRWIDEVTGTEAIPGSFHEKKGGSYKIDCAPRTEARIRTLYAEDYALIAQLAAGPVQGA